MTNSDSKLNKAVKRLYQFQIYCKWLLVIICWLSLGAFAIWELREDISLWLDYFTWAAVRYGLAYNLKATICLSISIGMTISVLIRQIENLFLGIPNKERYRLEKQVKEIQQKGPKHILYPWIFKGE